MNEMSVSISNQDLNFFSLAFDPKEKVCKILVRDLGTPKLIRPNPSQEIQRILHALDEVGYVAYVVCCVCRSTALDKTLCTCQWTWFEEHLPYVFEDLALECGNEDSCYWTRKPQMFLRGVFACRGSSFPSGYARLSGEKRRELSALIQQNLLISDPSNTAPKKEFIRNLHEFSDIDNLEDCITEALNELSEHQMSLNKLDSLAQECHRKSHIWLTVEELHIHKSAEAERLFIRAELSCTIILTLLSQILDRCMKLAVAWKSVLPGSALGQPNPERKSDLPKCERALVKTLTLNPGFRSGCFTNSRDYSEIVKKIRDARNFLSHDKCATAYLIDGSIQFHKSDSAIDLSTTSLLCTFQELKNWAACTFDLHLNLLNQMILEHTSMDQNAQCRITDGT